MTRGIGSVRPETRCKQEFFKLFISDGKKDSKSHCDSF